MGQNDDMTIRAPDPGDLGCTKIRNPSSLFRATPTYGSSQLRTGCRTTKKEKQQDTLDYYRHSCRSNMLLLYCSNRCRKQFHEGIQY